MEGPIFIRRRKSFRYPLVKPLMTMTNQEPVRIPGLPGYLLTPDDFIYNLKAKRKMTRRWTSTGWTTRVTGPDRVVRTIHHSKVLDMPLLAPTVAVETLSLKEIPDHPNYFISPTGAVYKVTRRRVTRVAEQTRGVQSYVNVVAYDGIRRIKNVRTLLRETFGEDPTED